MLTPSVPAVRDGKVFLVLRGELINIRLDPTYYFNAADTTGFVKLSKFVRVSGGKRLPLGHDFSDEPTNYRYLRVGDIDWQGDIDYDNFRYLSEATFNELKRYEIANSELAIAIVGATIGKVALIEKPYSDHIILTENCAKIRLKDNQVLPKYLYLLLKLDILQKQIQSNFIQTTLPKLGLDRLESLLIPPIPSLLKQQQIVQKMEAAYASKRAKEAEAARLLSSIDGYLLEQLGITLPEVAVKKKVFFVCSDKVSGGRFDPFYFANQHYKIEGGIYENKALRQVANLDKGQSITKDSIVGGEFPVIAGGQTSPYSHENYNQEANVITVSASGAYSGYVWFHDYPVFASDCTVIRSKNEREISTLFLSEILKLKQKEIYNLQQGAGQPHVYANDLAKLMIPIPASEIQEDIITHITAIRTQAQQLESEAKAAVEAAKKEVETMILGEGGGSA